MNAHEREILKLVNSREIDCDEFYIRIDRLTIQPPKQITQECDA